MAPGDVRDASLRIDLSYYYEATARGGGSLSESGYYSAFASIPVRVIAPRTYVYVQPSVDVSYEPFYVVRLLVDVWVEGEGFIENARAVVTGAPVQCYLLTTGRMEAGERRRLEFLINVTGLGPFARSQYNVQLEVTADTPWGYTYRYAYPLALTIKPPRGVAVSAPGLAAANALVPVRVSLDPPRDADERATLSVYWGARLVYSGEYSPLVYVALPEGEETLTVKVESSKYATAVGRARVRTVAVEPRVSAYVSGSALYYQVAPVYPDGRVDIKVVDSSGRTALATSVPASSLSLSPASVGGASAAEGRGVLTLDLSPGSYTVVVTYSAGPATKSAAVSYEVPGAAPVAGLPLPIPLPVLLVVAAAAAAAVAAVLLLRRRGVGEEAE